MVMMLPFLSAAVSVWFALRGRRAASLWSWVVTFGVFVAWCHYHMTDSLSLSL